MNRKLPPLLDELRQAINDAFWHSDRVIDAVEALGEALGDFRISIDLILPDGTGLPPGPRQFGSGTAKPDAQFHRSVKLRIEP